MNPIKPESVKQNGVAVRSGALLAAVKAWRTAEVHHAAITLELRDGDEQLAKTKLDDATRELRIAADEYLKAANDELCRVRKTD